MRSWKVIRKASGAYDFIPMGTPTDCTVIRASQTLTEAINLADRLNVARHNLTASEGLKS